VPGLVNKVTAIAPRLGSRAITRRVAAQVMRRVEG